MPIQCGKSNWTNFERSADFFFISGYLSGVKSVKTEFYLSGVKMASGAYTFPVDTFKFSDKTFYWQSADSSGVVDIQVRDPIGGWHVYASQPFKSGVLLSYIMTGQALAVRLRNEQTASGTITSWYVMRA